MMASERDRERKIRTRNRALLALLVALATLFYAVTIARMGG